MTPFYASNVGRRRQQHVILSPKKGSSRCQRKPARTKPKKPSEDFPLYAHANGRWAKKIRCKTHYFGPWADPESALANYLEQEDDLKNGRLPRKSTEGCVTVKQVCLAFLISKEALVKSGELSPRTFADYERMAKRVAKVFGKQRAISDLKPSDFAQLRSDIAASFGTAALGNEVTRVRTLFKYAHKSLLIDRDVHYGPDFEPPSQKKLRLDREERGQLMFENYEIRQLLLIAPQPYRAMIMLGVNTAFGNADVGKLPQSALDLDKGWVRFPRPKTGVARRIPLWPETIAEVRDAITNRPKPADPAYDKYVFLTADGLPFHRDGYGGTITTPFSKILKKAGLRRNRHGFYVLRRVFETIGGEVEDPVAVDAIMGHVDMSMGGRYRQRIGDNRLLKVTEHVRKWLFEEGDISD